MKLVIPCLYLLTATTGMSTEVIPLSFTQIAEIRTAFDDHRQCEEAAMKDTSPGYLARDQACDEQVKHTLEKVLGIKPK